MNLHRVFGLAIVSLLVTHEAWSQTFQPTTGTASWNDNNNWGPSPPQTFPNIAGATATLQAPTTPSLTVDLGTSITVGTLNINKDSGGFATTVGVGTTNTLTFDGTGSILNNGNSATAAGTTTVAAPIVFGASMPSSTFTISQKGANTLQLTGGMSGAGNLTINRDANGTGTVVLGAASSYTGTTALSNSLTGTNYLLVRLDDVNSIPGGIGTTGGTSNILATNSVIFGLSANSGNFTRGIGTGVDQLTQFNGSGNQGWAAFGSDRAVNLFGDGRRIIWGNSGAFFGNLTLSHTSADKTIDFQNILDLNTGGGATNRSIRIENGSAAIDAVISGRIEVGSGSGVLTFQAGGTVSLTAANTYNYTTSISNATTVILNKASALPGTNLSMTGNSILGLGNENDSFTRALGTTGSTVQFTGGGGFAAFGGNKTVNLGGAAATVTWGSGNFVTSGNNLTLSAVNSSGTLDFQNPIDVGSGVLKRTIVVDEGSAVIDAVLSGGIVGGGTNGIQKNGDGTLRLPTANSYSGQTDVNGGCLLLDNADALPVASQLTMRNAGVIGLGTGHTEFTRTLGSAAGQVSTSGTAGGFAAFGADKVVRLNNDANYTVVFKTVGLFDANQLVLSDGNATHTLDFQNKIDLNGAVRNIIVRNGSAAIDGRITNVISGSGASGINKNNPGTLELSAANDYAGITQISAGVLLLTNPSSIPGGINGGNTANILFGGSNPSGVIGLGQGGAGEGNFTSGLGIGAGQVDLGTSAGFAAFYANRFVNFGGGSAQVTWRNSVSDPGNFVVDSLRLSDVVADATVDFQNPIDLNGGARTVEVSNGTAETDAVLSGALSSGAGSLIKSGGGTLSLTAANTYDGGTTVSQGRLLVNNTTGSGTGTGAVSVTGTGSTLGGTGIIKPGTTAGINIASGSILSPGASIGTLTVDGATTTGTVLTLASGATIFDELNNSFLSDQVALIGGAASDIAFNNNTINFSDLSGGTLAAGAYTLFTADVAGAYSGLTTDGNGNITAGLSIGTGLSAYTASLLQVDNNIVLNIGLTGDYNGDTKVNAADFVTWRKDPTGHGGDPNGYATWRENFSQSAAAGAFLAGQAVPEPATIALLLLAIPLVGSRKLRCARV